MTHSPRRAAAVLAVTGAALFMIVLDNLIVVSTLPAIQRSLHGSLSSLEWIVDAYILSFGVLILSGAALGERFGRRRMFGVGLFVFTAASAAAALSPSVGALVAARAVQGAGAAIVTPLTLTLISAAVPAEKRGAAIGLWGGIAGLAVAAGPVVGGAVVDGLDWHWIFWLNVPIGLALIPLSAARLQESFGPATRLDIPGLGLAGMGLLGVTWGLVRANDAGWGSLEVVGSLAAGAALLYAFAAWERRAPDPMLPPALFRRRELASANAVSFFMYAGLFGVLFLMSQFLQSALGNSPLEAGLRLLPWTAPPMIVAPIAGVLADRYGNRPFMVLGLALQAVGYGWVALIVHPGMGYAELGVAFTVAGVGTSFCFPTVANAVMGSAPPELAGVASGTNSALRELGGVFGVAILAAVFARPGAYGSPQVFVHGFTQALWVGAALSALGIVAALLGSRWPRRLPEPRLAEV